MKDKGSKIASDYLSSWCCQPAHDVCLEAPWDIMITNEKNQSNFAKMLNQMSEQICLNLERRVMIPNLSTFTKKLPLRSLRDRPFNLKGGGVMVFSFVQNFFFGQHKS